MRVHPNNKSFDSMNSQPGDRKHQNSNIKKQGCKARCRIHLTKDNKQYKIYHFVDRHNHSLLNSADKRLLRINRQLKYTDYVKMIRGSSANIGPSTLYKMEAYLKSGYQYIEATIFDYQNARQDVVSFVGNKDAKMFVNLVEKCRLSVPEYFVEYKCVNRELHCIFWADEKIGDSISIDGTFRTNMYAMVFFPNHKKFVNVGSALICNEKTPTYDWVLMAVDPALLRPDEMIMILNLYLVNRFQDQDQETNEPVLQSTDPVH
ncbi:hypothetical protein OSB04_006452 [Centaurea solstitialis]|uniref:MULE transposase domain-containing protein n=1 Tax=Centaurea solstitialis TaxID=347529 RepID=A0AA38WHH0_9ASTR|nr:hypothetical protein OSB04_006452 [Centaurea solstitialis]